MQLVTRLAFALADDALEPARLFIQVVASPLRRRRLLLRFLFGVASGHGLGLPELLRHALLDVPFLRLGLCMLSVDVVREHRLGVRVLHVQLFGDARARLRGEARGGV